jgi:hypothetical protein
VQEAAPQPSRRRAAAALSAAAGLDVRVGVTSVTADSDSTLTGVTTELERPAGGNAECAAIHIYRL